MNKWRVVGNPMMKQGSWEYRDNDGVGKLLANIYMTANGYHVFTGRFERRRNFKKFDNAKKFVEDKFK